MHSELTVLQKLRSHCRAELLRVSSPTNSSNTSSHRANGERERGREGGREGGRERKCDREVGTKKGREKESERVERERREKIYYVSHAVRDGRHRELTVLQKLSSPCRAELL